MNTHLKITNIDSDLGLPSDQVHTIAQDAEKRLWFAGPAGLSRYDGNRISVFDIRNGLQCQGLRTIEIKDDIVWIGTDQGMETIHTNGSATNLTIPKDWIYGLVERIAIIDRTIWIGSSYGLLKLDYNSKDNSTLVVMSAKLGFIRDMVVLDKNYIIAATGKGLIYCNGKSYDTLLNNEIPEAAVIICLKQWSRERILVGTDMGMFIIDKSGAITDRITPPGNVIKITAISTLGNELWIAVGVNIYLYEETSAGIAFISSFFIGSSVNAIFKDALNNVWVGSNSGGAKKISCLRNVFSKIDTGVTGAVYSIRKTENDEFRIGGETFFSTISNPGDSTKEKNKILSGLPAMTIWDSCADPVDLNRTWLATQEGLFWVKDGAVEQFGKNNPILKSPARCLLVRENKIYVGTLNGLSMINGTNAEEIYGYKNINLGYVYSLELDEHAKMWIGTLGSGLWHESENELQQLTDENLRANGNTYVALPNNKREILIVQDEKVILIDKQGKSRLVLKEFPVAAWSAAWINESTVLLGSNDGLLVLDLNTNKIIRRVNPLLGKGGWQFTNNRALYFESEERIYCGLNAGLYCISIKEINQYSNAPVISLNQVIWDNVIPEKKRDVYHLKPEKWSMEASVFCAWFVDEDMVRFRFKLIGFDENWSALHHSSHIKYTSLPPGKYELKGQVYTALTGFGHATTLIKIQVDSLWWTIGLFKPFEWLTTSYDRHFTSGIKNKKLIARNKELENEITERKNAEKKIKESEEKYRTLVEQATDGIIIINNEGRFITVNKSACLISQYTEEELLQKTIYDMAILDDLTNIPFRFEELKNGEPIRTERPMKRKDGQTLIIEINAKLLTNGDLLIFIRDITIRKKNENELEKHRNNLKEIVEQRTLALQKKSDELQANQTILLNLVDDLKLKSEELILAKTLAEAADNLKSSFLATMSHELRTPLNSIIGFTGIILEGLAGPLTDEQNKQLGMVNKSAHLLLSLINDILDLSKIEAGQLHISKEPFNINDSISKVLSIVSPLAQKKGLLLINQNDNSTEEIVNDQRRFEQILINLLNNAIKFTEHGEISLKTALISNFNTKNSFNTQPAIRISVIDTGIGIKQENVSMLFSPFSQIDSTLARNHEGTGLGLAICKRLVDLMGGKIKVDSVFGKGSTFTIIIPINNPD